MDTRLENYKDNEQHQPPYDQEDVSKAFQVIKQAMIDDQPSEEGSLAHSWHCNIAMMCHDAILNHDDQVDYAHEIGNDAATRFMKLCFNVETSARTASSS